jgi:hypothetical protein
MKGKAMLKARLFAGLLTLGALAAAGDARAEGMSCKNRLVSTGDSVYKVRSLCGEPDAAQRRVELRTVKHRVRQPCDHDKEVTCEHVVERTVEVVVDEWTYDFGRNRFIRFVTFEQGALKSVRAGSYGHKDPA